MKMRRFLLVTLAIILFVNVCNGNPEETQEKPRRGIISSVYHGIGSLIDRFRGSGKEAPSTVTPATAIISTQKITEAATAATTAAPKIQPTPVSTIGAISTEKLDLAKTITPVTTITTPTKSNFSQSMGPPTMCYLKKCILVADAEEIYRSVVCGTDNITYVNIRMLICHRRECDSTMTLHKMGPCNPPPRPTYEPEDLPSFLSKGNTGTLNTNCFTDCAKPYSSHSPVCATDRRSYENEDHVDCANKCGKTIGILRQGKCQG